jgi:hypothetical protein
MGRFARSFALAKASWQILISEKEMLGYTALGAILTVIAVAALAAPAVVILILTGPSSSSGAAGRSPLGWVLLFVFYLVVSFITLFFNTALIGAALTRLRGGKPSFSTGMQVATRNVGHIFAFALISATVGVILAIIEEKFQVVGQIVAGIIGGAWGIVTFLVVPVMVAEDINPFDAIKRSGQLLRQTWGEQIIGSGGISLVIFLLALPAAIPVLLGVAIASTAGAIAGAVIAVLYLGVLFLVGSALNGIYRAALYLYATTGANPSQFDTGLLQDAFRQKSAAKAA